LRDAINTHVLAQRGLIGEPAVAYLPAMDSARYRQRQSPDLNTTPGDIDARCVVQRINSSSTSACDQGDRLLGAACPRLAESPKSSRQATTCRLVNQKRPTRDRGINQNK
jgi:hypothetical protein